MNTLFYIEDDQALAYMTIKALTRQGFDVKHAVDLREAQGLIDQFAYSHALLDLKLNDGNAMVLVPELVKLNPQIKILLLTGYASIATAVQAIKLGAHNYLPKPATLDEIMTAFGEQNPIDNTVGNNISLKRLEWEKIQQALTDNDGNISATARQLKMHRRTLQRKLEKRPVTE